MGVPLWTYRGGVRHGVRDAALAAQVAELALLGLVQLGEFDRHQVFEPNGLVRDRAPHLVVGLLRVLDVRVRRRVGDPEAGWQPLRWLVPYLQRYLAGRDLAD